MPFSSKKKTIDLFFHIQTSQFCLITSHLHSSYAYNAHVLPQSTYSKSPTFLSGFTVIQLLVYTITVVNTILLIAYHMESHPGYCWLIPSITRTSKCSKQIASVNPILQKTPLYLLHCYHIYGAPSYITFVALPTPTLPLQNPLFKHDLFRKVSMITILKICNITQQHIIVLTAIFLLLVRFSKIESSLCDFQRQNLLYVCIAKRVASLLSLYCKTATFCFSWKGQGLNILRIFTAYASKVIPFFML